MMKYEKKILNKEKILIQIKTFYLGFLSVAFSKTLRISFCVS